MILVMTTPNTDQFVTMNVPARDYQDLVSWVSLAYRRAVRPLTIGSLMNRLQGKLAEGHAVAFITVEGFKAKISYPGNPEFTAQTYEGRPQVNVIPRLVPDLPDTIRYQEGKRG